MEAVVFVSNGEGFGDGLCATYAFVEGSGFLAFSGFDAGPVYGGEVVIEIFFKKAQVFQEIVYDLCGFFGAESVRGREYEHSLVGRSFADGECSEESGVLSVGEMRDFSFFGPILYEGSEFCGIGVDEVAIFEWEDLMFVAEGV